MKTEIGRHGAHWFALFETRRAVALESYVSRVRPFESQKLRRELRLVLLGPLGEDGRVDGAAFAVGELKPDVV